MEHIKEEHPTLYPFWDVEMHGMALMVQDVGEYLGTDAGDATFNDPSAGVIMELVSSSTNDTSGGTGTQTVRVAQTHLITYNGQM